MTYVSKMYRCYLIRNGRIARGEDIDSPALDEAIAVARAMFGGGFEVWRGGALLHSERSDEMIDPIASPFETAESTMFPTWRPTKARPIGMSIMANI